MQNEKCGLLGYSTFSPGLPLQMFFSHYKTKFGHTEANRSIHIVKERKCFITLFTVIWRQDMVKDHSDRGNLLPLHGLLFLIAARFVFICTIPIRIAYTTAFLTPVVQDRKVIYVEGLFINCFTWPKEQSFSSLDKILTSYRVHFTSTRFCSASAEHISLHYHCMLPVQQMYMVLVLRGISTSVP